MSVSSMLESDDLKFVPFHSVVDTSFWAGLSKSKLEVYKLTEGPFSITAEFSNGTAFGVSPRINVDMDSLNESSASLSSRNNIFRLRGSLLTLNTLDQFKILNKQAYIDKFGLEHVSSSVASKDFKKNPNSLLDFLLLTYCNLKHHTFIFWFAFPAVAQQKKPKILSRKSLVEGFSPEQISCFLESYDAWRKHSTDIFFCTRVNEEDNIQVLNFDEFEIEHSTDYVAFCDPSSDPEHPGWPLRNLLYALSTTIHDNKELKVICFRDRYENEQRIIKHSLIFNLQLSHEVKNPALNFVGWEQWKGKLQPRMVDLSSEMDPVKLADSAADLNLKLMIWRMLPTLDLSVLHQTRCLILGSGTLGCNVARQLLAWGFRNMTLVDNATVSYSNPVRQTLFTFDDAVAGLKKSTAASAALKRIFPSVNVNGVDLTVPMPGHPIVLSSASLSESTQIAAAREACIKLDELIRTHDVIFLLLDTREARWLPSMLTTYHARLAITAALGFDSYLVMRHGVPTRQATSPSHSGDNGVLDQCKEGSGNSFVAKKLNHIPGSRLGCYFCNDVVGPSNSLRDRTLDQQCTVSRPGASMLAAANAVELCVGLLQHSAGGNAPAYLHGMGDETKISQNSTFCFLPHQIRGFLSQFSEVLPCTTAFSSCSACSQPILDAYAKDGFEFLLRVFEDSSYLELVSGLKELQLETNFDEVLTLSDNDSE